MAVPVTEDDVRVIRSLDEVADKDEEALNAAALDSVRVENGVGSIDCDVAVAWLTPKAWRYAAFASAMLTFEFGDVKLLMQMLICPVAVVHVSPATALQQN